MDTECIIWPRGMSGDGYGLVWSFAEKRQLKAHRHVWQECFGWIPDGLHVLHKCDTPPCVNPEHLFLGTNQDNIRDCRSKDRGYYQSGERGPGARLTWEEVRRMRSLHDKNGISTPKLAAMFGISTGHAWKIVAGKQWKETP